MVTLAEARARTNLDLVSAKEITSERGISYHEMEEASESRSHRSAREDGIMYFSAIGYDIYPGGIGVRGTYALADFLAIRNNRTVFVEVLADANFKEETIIKKCRLQDHGDLCFILFSGTKRTDHDGILQTKRALQSRADVIFYRLDGYGGNSIEDRLTATIAYDTTRGRGIQVAISFARSGRTVIAAIKFLTHLYQVTLDRHTYFPTPIYHHYEQIFSDIFGKLSYRLGHSISRVVRKNSGRRMNDIKGRAVARFKTEYRGPADKYIDHELNNPFSSEISPDDIFGVITFERPTGFLFRELINVIEQYGLKPEFDPTQLETQIPKQ